MTKLKSSRKIGKFDHRNSPPFSELPWSSPFEVSTSSTSPFLIRRRDALYAITRVTARGSKTITKIKINHLTTRLTARSNASLIKTGFSVNSACCTSESNARATNLNDPISVARILLSKSKFWLPPAPFWFVTVFHFLDFRGTIRTVGRISLTQGGNFLTRFCNLTLQCCNSIIYRCTCFL